MNPHHSSSVACFIFQHYCQNPNSIATQLNVPYIGIHTKMTKWLCINTRPLPLYKDLVSKIECWPKYVLYPIFFFYFGVNLFSHLICFMTNKPSFWTGSCDEIHATTKWQNKTSLKDYWNTFETFYEIFLKYTWHFL